MIPVILILISLCTPCFADGTNSDIGPELLAAMKAYKIPVAGYAIIKNRRIVAAETVSIDPKIQVSKDSMFQAASISKAVTAYAVLK